MSLAFLLVQRSGTADTEIEDCYYALQLAVDQNVKLVRGLSSSQALVMQSCLTEHSTCGQTCSKCQLYKVTAADARIVVSIMTFEVAKAS